VSIPCFNLVFVAFEYFFRRYASHIWWGKASLCAEKCCHFDVL